MSIYSSVFSPVWHMQLSHCSVCLHTLSSRSSFTPNAWLDIILRVSASLACCWASLRCFSLASFLCCWSCKALNCFFRDDEDDSIAAMVMGEHCDQEMDNKMACILTLRSRFLHFTVTLLPQYIAVRYNAISDTTRFFLRPQMIFKRGQQT